MNPLSPQDHPVEGTKLRELALLRGIGTISVITLHVTTYFTEMRSSDWLFYTNMLFCLLQAFAVPMFFFVSGFALSKRYWNNYSLPKYYWRRAVSVVPQYVLFSLLYTVFFRYLSSGNIGESVSSFDLWQFVRYVLPYGTASYHLWFLPVLIQLYVFYPLIVWGCRLLEEQARPYLPLILALVVQILWGSAALVARDLDHQGFLYKLFSKPAFLGVLFFFVLGIAVQRHYDRVKLHLLSDQPRVSPFLALLAFLAIFFNSVTGIREGYTFDMIPSYYGFGNTFLYPLFVSAMVFFLLNISLRLAKREGAVQRLLEKLGERSLGIYLVHVFFIVLLVQALRLVNIDCNKWQFYVLLLIGTLATSCLSVYLGSFLPFSEYYLGTHTRLNRKQRPGH